MAEYVLILDETAKLLRMDKKMALSVKTSRKDNCNKIEQLYLTIKTSFVPSSLTR